MLSALAAAYLEAVQALVRGLTVNDHLDEVRRLGAALGVVLYDDGRVHERYRQTCTVDCQQCLAMDALYTAIEWAEDPARCAIGSLGECLRAAYYAILDLDYAAVTRERARECEESVRATLMDAFPQG